VLVWNGGLTLDFWGLIIGIRLFGFYVYKLYPVAFVMVIVGTPPSPSPVISPFLPLPSHRLLIS